MPSIGPREHDIILLKLPSVADNNEVNVKLAASSASWSSLARTSKILDRIESGGFRGTWQEPQNQTTLDSPRSRLNEAQRNAILRLASQQAAAIMQMRRRRLDAVIAQQERNNIELKGQIRLVQVMCFFQGILSVLDLGLGRATGAGVLAIIVGLVGVGWKLHLAVAAYCAWSFIDAFVQIARLFLPHPFGVDSLQEEVPAAEALTISFRVLLGLIAGSLAAIVVDRLAGSNMLQCVRFGCVGRGSCAGYSSNNLGDRRGLAASEHRLPASSGAFRQDQPPVDVPVLRSTIQAGQAQQQSSRLLRTRSRRNLRLHQTTAGLLRRGESARLAELRLAAAENTRSNHDSVGGASEAQADRASDASTTFEGGSLSHQSIPLDFRASASEAQAGDTTSINPLTMNGAGRH